jgi:hypothetical protein
MPEIVEATIVVRCNQEQSDQRRIKDTETTSEHGRGKNGDKSSEEIEISVEYFS